MHAQLLAMLLGLGGCTDVCTGATCGELYTASDLRVLWDVLDGSAEQSPLDADWTLSEASEAGIGWALAASENTIWAGIPDLDQVRAYAPADGSTDAVATVDAPAPGSRFGSAVARVGGVIAVGAPAFSPEPGRRSAGALYLVDAADPSRVIRVDGERAQDQLGDVVAGCGDLDGDGEADVAAAAPWSGDLAGAVVVVGAAQSVDAAAVDLVYVRGVQPNARFGSALACAADVTGDGKADLAIGAPYATGLGEAGGMGSVTLLNGGTVEAGASLVLQPAEDEAAPAYFGAAVATGDLDADGHADLVVGAPGAEAGLGAAWVYFGVDLAAAVATGVNPAPAAIVRGSEESGRLGTTVSAHDLDGDGRDELIVGAPGVSPTGTDEDREAGAVYVYTGTPAEWGVEGSQPSVTLSAARAYLRTGERFLAADLDGDAQAELAVLGRAEAR
jgi:hypothetical protein